MNVTFHVSLLWVRKTLDCVPSSKGRPVMICKAASCICSCVVSTKALTRITGGIIYVTCSADAKSKRTRQKARAWTRFPTFQWWTRYGAWKCDKAKLKHKALCDLFLLSKNVCNHNSESGKLQYGIAHGHTQALFVWFGGWLAAIPALNSRHYI